MNPIPWIIRTALAVPLTAGILTCPTIGREPADKSDAARETKTFEEDELTRRLKNAETGKSEDGLLDRMLRYMRQSQDRLHAQYDPGPPTQDIQKKIIKSLDEAIEQARRNSSSSSSSSSPSGDQDAGSRKRNRPMPKPSENDASKPKPAEGSASENRDGSGKGSVRSGKLGGQLREAGREWGNLPPRDREEVVQGIREQVLLKYREAIEKYYRALAEQANR